VPVPFFFEGAPAVYGIGPSAGQTAEASSPSYVADFIATSDGLSLVKAFMSIEAHPHMLRHACGYALANKGHSGNQAWLGNRSITSTAIYAALAPNRFKDFWRD
jgi:integrase